MISNYYNEPRARDLANLKKLPRRHRELYQNSFALKHNAALYTHCDTNSLNIADAPVNIDKQTNIHTNKQTINQSINQTNKCNITYITYISCTLV